MEHIEIFEKDYKAPDFFVESTELDFEIEEDLTKVSSRVKIKRVGERDAPLVLNGIDLKLVSIKIDGTDINDLEIEDNILIIKKVPDRFLLEVVVKIDPKNNETLHGLYESNNLYCTQCEPDGFRRITYYIDRPDIMSPFKVKITANKRKYPVLLSNGNNIDNGELDDGRHFTVWEDPHKKPCYLFALVAGDLITKEDHFTTMSGRDVTLRILVEEKNKDKTDHAMYALKQAMKFDEQTYGREYDLDLFMIVAVDDFNAGAMENKGLNIFNSSCILCKPECTTDFAIQRIEGIIGHEYFHNWSGNRVTLRDWFQLSLKEGFTVFRDQHFSGVERSAVVNRIEDTRDLRTTQFAEDSSAMSHPVKLKSYVAISNFYTSTVYDKGAEVIRMLYTILGPDGFRKGTDYYFKTYDGMAVTTNEFVRSMEEANNIDLSQFKVWYTQSGTPIINVEDEYDKEKQTYTLKIRQHTAPTHDQKEKVLAYIPIKIGLLGSDGKDMLLGEGKTEKVIIVKDAEQSFLFENIKEKPIPSLLRGFSAPVKLYYDYSDDDLMFLMTHDTDGFNKWDAGNELATKLMLKLIQDELEGRELHIAQKIIDAFDSLLDESQKEGADKDLISVMLELPGEQYLAERLDVIEIEATHKVRQFIKKEIAIALKEKFRLVYNKNQEEGELKITTEAMARRALKNNCLAYLMELEDEEFRDLTMNQFESANNMTDEVRALALLVNSDFTAEKEKAIKAFYEKWKQDTIVLDMWFSVQSTASNDDALVNIKKLMEHEAFNIKNPNKARAVIGGFSARNPINFHTQEGYDFLTEQVLVIDKFNEMMASRLLKPYSHIKKFPKEKQEMMKEQLNKVLTTEGISKASYEVASRSLKAAE